MSTSENFEKKPKRRKVRKKSLLGSRLRRMTKFADYFAISGLDHSSGLEPDQLSGDTLHYTPLERPYKSKVLGHYPENVPGNPFDKSAVGMLCLPKGLTFKTQKHEKEPKFHSFIITREDGSRTYGFAYTFFEELSNKQICTAMQTLQAMHLAELSNSQSRTLYPQPDTGTRSLPRSFKLSKNSSHANNFYDIHKDILYVTKCICLICQLPFVNACRQFLTSLHRAICSTDPPPMPLESYVYNILYEVPLPPPGRSMSFLCFGHQVYVQRPGVGELPLFEFSLREMFSLLGVENVIQLFTCVLLEHQILLYAEDYHKLMLIAESITMLLFPFTWQHVYVPILPASLLHFLDAPVPFIMGLHHGSEDRSQLQLPGEANLCFVDIDNHVVELPEDLPQFPNKHEWIQELSKVVADYNVPIHPKGGYDNNSNERSYNRMRKYSWSFDHDSGMSSSEGSRSSSHSNLTNRFEILQQSEALAKIAAIARRTGVITSLEDELEKSRQDSQGNLAHGKTDPYLEELRFDNAVREIFLNHFTHLFRAYEHFVIQPNQDMDSWLSSRESMQNFDKAAFLSDQSEIYLPFLSPFLETQMFATLIDNKIMSQWEEPDMYLKVFDSRVKNLRDNQDTYGDSMETLRDSESFPTIRDSEACIQKRAMSIDVVAQQPHVIDIRSEQEVQHIPFFFPMLDAVALNKEPVQNKTTKRRLSAQWRLKDRQLQHTQHVHLSFEQREKYIQEAHNKTLRPTKFLDMSPAIMAQTNWNFVETLLKECRTKTKRMLVEKMGQEAVELGHGGEISITGVEENTLIASLCDLLERIWSHGLQSKQGKSALWSHLLSYHEIQECNNTSKPIDPNFLTPAPLPPRPPARTRSISIDVPALIYPINLRKLLSLRKFANFGFGDISTMALEVDSPPKGSKDKKEKKKNKSPEPPMFKALPVSLIFDMKNVQAMTEIKTDIGYARAWVRLSLEKKLLSKHLKTLLADQELLKSLYKRYAFLRSDDEKEQFLYHLLTLNAVDYYCFTNTFTSTTMVLTRQFRVIPYRVVIFPSRKFSASTTSANVWVCLAGTLGESGLIRVPKTTLEIVFQHKNLGLLTTLRIGHDNSGMSPKWMVEHVLVRNEVTGHTYKFPCGRWLGKGIDDGSTERLLVGELVPPSTDSEELMNTCRTPPRCRSPSMPRRPSEARLTIPVIQQMLGDAVNSIVKYYYKPEKERGSLTILLCGEMGLVYCLEQVFLYGFRSTRFFRHVYLWDFFEKVYTYFETILHDDETVMPIEHQEAISTYCHQMTKINGSSQSVGKDGKFQLFICLAARDRVLHQWILHIASTPVTMGMYEEHSFLRDPILVTFLVQILGSLSEFNIVLEASLTKGIDV